MYPIMLQRFSYTTGEAVYAAPSKKSSTGGGTLGRRTRRGHTSALSSSSTASDRSETVFPDEHSRMHLTNGKLTPLSSRLLSIGSFSLPVIASCTFYCIDPFIACTHHHLASDLS